jgi:hypothetical protein
VGFPFELRAKSRKRKGLFRKAPDPRDITERFGWLVRRMYKTAVVGKKLIINDVAVTMTVTDDAELVASGDAWLGPGFVAELAGKLAPILDELDYVWIEPLDLAGWQTKLRAQLVDQLREGETRFGVPAGRRFRIDAPVLTALGPREAGWTTYEDAFPWWETGPGRQQLARALVAMWLEVPWREPLDGDEREMMKQVDEDLRAAHEAKLAVPWDAWQELLANLGIEDEVVEESARGLTPQRIGYRRHALDVELSGGWQVTMPGAMVGHWEDEGARYWATDGDYVIEFSSLTADGETDSDKLLAVAPEAHPVVERMSTGDLRGRAEAFVDDDVHVLIGLVAEAPHVGILTCKSNEADDSWARAMWKSLRRR